jgi:hypothetical protein
MRFALYPDDGTGKPSGTTITGADSGTVATTSIAIASIGSLTWAVTTPGWYWILACPQSGTIPTIRFIYTGFWGNASVASGSSQTTIQGSGSLGDGSAFASNTLSGFTWAVGNYGNAQIQA